MCVLADKASRYDTIAPPSGVCHTHPGYTSQSCTLPTAVVVDSMDVTFEAVACGAYHTLACTTAATEGLVYSWGLGKDGQSATRILSTLIRIFSTLVRIYRYPSFAFISTLYSHLRAGVRPCCNTCCCACC